MAARLAKNPGISRSEQVRRRRQQKTKRRYDAVSRVGGTTLRSGPLVSRPRTAPATSRLAHAGRRGSGMLAALLPAGVSLSLPALPRVRLGWRAMSITLVALLSVLLGRMLTDPGMYINGVNLGGAALVPGEEIYAAAGIAGQHIFWVDAAEVQRKVSAVPGIASANVHIDWPATVTIQVVERIPVVSWTEGSQKSWVDADGNKFAARTDLPGLLPITVDDAAGTAYKIAPPAAVAGALQLQQLRPNIEMLHYDSQHGLSYQDGRGWRGYFGVGTDMVQKLAVYEQLVTNLTARGVQPKTISVESYQAPYYTK
jgi:cell division septal protein FtsQ